MPTYHPYAEKRTNGTNLNPKAILKNLGGLTTAEKIVALWKATSLTYAEIGRLVGISRSGVSGAIDRHKRKHLGHVPVERGYYVNVNREPKGNPTYGYDKYRPFSHAADTTNEEETRNKLRSFLR